MASGAAMSPDPRTSSGPPRDSVAAFQELAKLKRGLPRHLVAEIEKRKITTVEEATRVAQILRNRRVKSHKAAVRRKSTKKAKPRKTEKPGELTRPGGKVARKVIASVKRALNNGVVKL
ncbi:hypothetical protein BaOVIS_023340 [Babesia ovis]|uniref:Uncharacterized protein n=1 Tax=Babesia ovis TaxID=5869 RepID=A0A9W5WVD3_BABOV|nr:hypothetical protein BaOVIS_023340 [Babesia ovis]